MYSKTCYLCDLKDPYMQGINKAVISGINKGDVDAFRLLYNSYYAYLCTCAAAYLLNHEKAKEIVNDVFLSLWDRRATLDFPIHSYLLASVRNASLNELRRIKADKNSIHYQNINILDIQESFCKTDITPIDYLEYKELTGKIDLIIAKLPQRCREIFEESFYENKSTAEISQKFQISESTVRVQRKMALDIIRENLGSSTLLKLFLLLSSNLL